MIRRLFVHNIKSFNEFNGLKLIRNSLPYLYHTNLRHFGGSVSDNKSINDPPSIVWVTSRNSMANRRIVHELGIVSAVAFRSKHVFMDFWAAIVGMFGGEIVTYTDLMSQCANEASQRVRDIAADLGATSVVNLRYETTSTMNRLIVGIHCSVYCYGTAVIDEPIDTNCDALDEEDLVETCIEIEKDNNTSLDNNDSLDNNNFVNDNNDKNK